MQRARRILCAIGTALCAGQAHAAEKQYAFGVFPYLPLATIYELYAPVATDFEAKVRRRVQLSSKSGYESFNGQLRKQIYDIAFVQPFDYVEAYDKYGYLPLARKKGDLQALIVVRQDSPLRTIRDLKGRTLANPPADAAVSHLTSMALRDAGIDPATGVKRFYGKNHFACLQSVLIGAADACGTAEQPLRTLKHEGQITIPLRVLHKTVRIPPALFVAHRRVPEKDRDILLRTIVGWPNTQEGKAIIKAGRFVPFVAAKDSDYEVVRRYVRNGR